MSGIYKKLEIQKDVICNNWKQNERPLPIIRIKEEVKTEKARLRQLATVFKL